MALTENRQIAIWPTAKAACRMVWAARKQHAILSVLALLPMAIAGIFDLRPHDLLIYYLIWDLLWLIPLGILWQRLFLVGPDLFLKVSAGQLFMIWLRLIGYYLALIVAILVIAFITKAATYGLIWLWQTGLGISNNQVQTLTTIAMTLIFLVVSLVMILRVMPTYVAVTVEEKITPRSAWMIMEGNAGRLLVTILLLVLTVMLIDFVFGAALGFTARMVRGSEMPGLLMWGTFLISLLSSPLLMAGLALHMAAQAIVYRDLVPQPEHLVDVTV